MRAIFDASLKELWADLLEMAHHVDSAVSRASCLPSSVSRRPGSPSGPGASADA